MSTRAYQPADFEAAVPGSVSGNCAAQGKDHSESKGHSGGAAPEPAARCLRVSAAIWHRPGEDASSSTPAPLPNPEGSARAPGLWDAGGGWGMLGL